MADAAAPAPPPAEPAAAEAGGEGEAEAKPAVELTPEEVRNNALSHLYVCNS